MSPFSFSRRTLLGGALAGTALAAAGCSSPAQPSAAPVPTGTEIVGKKDLTVYAWTNGTTIDQNFKKSVESFNKAMSGKFTAKINFLPYDQYCVGSRQICRRQSAADQADDRSGGARRFSLSCRFLQGRRLEVFDFSGVRRSPVAVAVWGPSYEEGSRPSAPPISAVGTGSPPALVSLGQSWWAGS